MAFDRGLVRTRLGFVHYRATGSGPAVILFHINQQSSALMRELMEGLAPAHRVVAMDYPSHGDSDPIDSQPDFSDYAECGIAVLDALGIGTAAAMGEAVGAGVSAAIANAYPDRINRVALINCPFSPERGRTATHVRELQSGLRPEDESGFPLTRTLRFMLETDPGHAPMHPTQDWMDRINTAAMQVGRRRWQAVTALARFDLDDALRRLAQPTQLFLGEHFHYTPHLPEMAARIRDLRHAVLPDSRFCMSWERAPEIAAAAMPFLRA